MKNQIVNKGGKLQSVSGESAMDVMRIRTLMVGLNMLVNTGGRLQPTRGFTLTKALKMATEYTGNKYKRTEGRRAHEELGKIMNLRLQHIEIKEGI